MIGIKNLKSLFKINSSGAAKRLFVLAFLLVVSISVLMPQPASACGTDLACYIKEFFKRFILSALGSITAFVLAIFSWFLSIFTWLIKEIVDWMVEFSLSVPYTSGPVIDSTWPVVRDLANMGLVLVLVAIGIGTILNLKQGAYRKRLGAFFLIALLINFTPVITGVVIDMSNIAARVFYDSAVNSPSALISFGPGEAFGVNFSDGWQIMQNMWEEPNQDTAFKELLAVLVKGVAGIAFSIMLIFLFILLAVLFLARTLFLWLLVVLSPLAFLMYVLPSTKKWFDRWWNNFFQWAFIVVPLLFFLWMAGLFANNGKTVCKSALDRDSIVYYGTEDAEFDEEAICGAANGVLAALALFSGIVISMHSSAEGAKIVTSKTKVLSLAASKKLGRGFEKGVYRSPQRMRQLKENMSAEERAKRKAVRSQRTLGQNLKSFSMGALGAAGTATGVPAGYRAARRTISDRRSQVLQEWEKKYKKNYSTPAVAASALNYEKDPEKRAYIMDYLAKEKPEELHKYYDNLKPDQQAEFMKGVEQREKMYAGSSKNVQKIFPHLIQDAEKQKKVVGGLSGKDITNMHKQAYKDDGLVTEIVKNPNLRQREVGELMKNEEVRNSLVGYLAGNRGVPTLEKMKTDIGEDRAKQVYKWLKTSPGGATVIENAEKQVHQSEKSKEASEKIKAIDNQIKNKNKGFDEEEEKINNQLNSSVNLPDKTKAELKTKLAQLKEQKAKSMESGDLKKLKDQRLENEEVLKGEEPKSILGWMGELAKIDKGSFGGSLDDEDIRRREEEAAEKAREEAKQANEE